MDRISSVPNDHVHCVSRERNSHGNSVISCIGEPLDLSVWTVADEADHTYTFPRGTSLAAGATVTLHTGSWTDTETDHYWGSSSASISSLNCSFVSKPNRVPGYAYSDSWRYIAGLPGNDERQLQRVFTALVVFMHVEPLPKRLSLSRREGVVIADRRRENHYHILRAPSY
ncbi:lamin tail domain-containing protein [Halocatena pleomorpha]|uniref:Lamin tail domain-containing protein n=1 Tax=Halocatena pleomorpha TaxID=1785090 RepID=A0A3P3RML1_9EURY|nr:lamin tail domain-containing protein [Halocatena pleomorpha]